MWPDSRLSEPVKLNSPSDGAKSVSVRVSISATRLWNNGSVDSSKIMSYEDEVDAVHVSVGVVFPVKLCPVWFHNDSPSHGEVSDGATVTGVDQSYLM